MKTIILITVLYVSWTLAEPPKPYRIPLRKRHAIIKRDVSHLLGNQGKSHSHHHHYDGMKIPTLDTNEQNDKPQYQIGKYAGVPMMGWFDINPALGVSRFPPGFQSSKVTKYSTQNELDSATINEPPKLYVPPATSPPPGVHYLPPGSSAQYPNIHYLPPQQPEGNQPTQGSEEQPTYQPYPQPTQPTHGETYVYPQPRQPANGGKGTYVYPQPTNGNGGQTSYLYPQPTQAAPQPNKPEYETPQYPTYLEQLFKGYPNAQVYYLKPSQQNNGDGEEEPIFNYKPYPHPGVDVPSRNYLPVPVKTPKPEVEVPPSNYLPVPVENPEVETPIPTPSKNYVPAPPNSYIPPRPTTNPNNYIPPSPTGPTVIQPPSQNYLPVSSNGYLSPSPTEPTVNQPPSQNYLPVPSNGYLPPSPTNPTVIKPPSQNYLPVPSTNYLPPSENIKNQFNQQQNYWQQQSLNSQKHLEETNVHKKPSFNGQSSKFKKNPWKPVTYDHSAFEHYKHQSISSLNPSKTQWNQDNFQKGGSPPQNLINDEKYHQIDSSTQHSHKIEVEAFNGKLLTNQDQIQASLNKNQKQPNGKQIDESVKKHWSHNVKSRYRHKDHSTTKKMNNQQQTAEQQNQYKQHRSIVEKQFIINENNKDGRYLRSNKKQESVFNGYEYNPNGYQYPSPDVTLEEENGSSKINKLPGFGKGKGEKGKNKKPKDEIKYHEQTFTGIKQRNPVRLAENTEEPQVVQENQSESEHLNDHEEIDAVQQGEDETVIGNPSTVLQPPKYTSESKKSSKQAVKPIKKFQYQKVASLKHNNKGDLKQKNDNKKLTEKQQFTSGIKDNRAVYNNLQQVQQDDLSEIDQLHQHNDILTQINQRPAQQYNHNIPQSKYQNVVEGHFPSGNTNEKVSDLVISVSQKHHREIDQFQHASKDVPAWNQYNSAEEVGVPNKSKNQQRPVTHEEVQQDPNAHQYQEINVGREEFSQKQVHHESNVHENQDNNGYTVYRQSQANEESSVHQNQGSSGEHVYRQSGVQVQINGEEREIKSHQHQVPAGNYNQYRQQSSQKQQQDIEFENQNGFNENEQTSDEQDFTQQEFSISQQEPSSKLTPPQQQTGKFRVIEDYNHYNQAKRQEIKGNKSKIPNKSELEKYPPSVGVEENDYNQGRKSKLREVEQNRGILQIAESQYKQPNFQQINLNQYEKERTRASQQQIVEISKNQHQLQNDFRTADYGIEFSYGSGNGTGNTKVWLDPTHGIPEQQQQQQDDIDSIENPDDDVEYHEIESNPSSGENKKSEDLIVVVHTDLLRGIDGFRNRGRGGRRRNRNRGRGGRGGRFRDDYREEENNNEKPKPQGNDNKTQNGKGKQKLVQESQIYSHPNHNASNGHSQTEPEPYYY